MERDPSSPATRLTWHVTWVILFHEPWLSHQEFLGELHLWVELRVVCGWAQALR